MLQTRRIILAAALAAVLAVGAGVTFAAGTFGPGDSPSGTTGASAANCWSLLERVRSKLPPPMQTTPTTAPGIHVVKDQPACAIQVSH